MEQILYIKRVLIDSGKRMRKQSFSKFSIKEQTFFYKKTFIPNKGWYTCSGQSPDDKRAK